MITLKTLPEATAQEVFDHVATHLLTQKKKSLHSLELLGADLAGGLGGDPGYEACRYRGDNGLKCAAGCLIGDDEYKQSWEGTLWSDLVLDARNQIPTAHMDLIHDLQNIHDGYPSRSWYGALVRLAFNERLNTYAIQKFEPGLTHND